MESGKRCIRKLFLPCTATPAGKTPAAAAAPTADAPTSCTAGDLLCLQRLALRCDNCTYHLQIARPTDPCGFAPMQALHCRTTLQQQLLRVVNVNLSLLCRAAATGKCAAASKAADDAMAAINSGTFTPMNGGGA